jgi:coenzyme F420-0:L-glutamate ligase/coenzyme F420-1:gamma-L-glutamate ligase
VEGGWRKLPSRIEVLGVTGLPLVRKGDDLGSMIATAVRSSGIRPVPGDVLVVAQTIVSRAEGSVVRLEDVVPTPRAIRYGEETGKDARLVEVILSQSRSVVWAGEGFMICETKSGMVCANAGVDQSNVEEGSVTVLPEDPDASARAISETLLRETGTRLPVVVSDSGGRPFRRGGIGVAVGITGMAPVKSMAGIRDYFGRELETTEVAVADLVCSAASLVMGEAAEGVPVALVRGFEPEGEGCIRDILYERDVFKEEMLGRKGP